MTAHLTLGALGLAIGSVILPFVLWGCAHVTAAKHAAPRHTQHDLDRALDQAMQNHGAGQSNAAFFLIECNGVKRKTRAVQVLQAALRPDDICVLQDTGRIGVCALSIRRFEVEIGLQIAERLRLAIAPLSDGTQPIDIGFCLASRAPNERPSALVNGAERALEEAQSRGSTGICAYSKLLGGTTTRLDLVTQVKQAFANNDIRPAFQPQIDGATGQIIGAEALARWHHPKHGIIPPAEFLSAVKSAGHWSQLTDTMLHAALTQLAAWDAQGMDVGQVGVNFSETDLAHPDIVTRVEWALDAAGLPPYRLAVEVLESVAADKDPTILKHVSDLAELGCHIDIDDFGMGHAAISTLRQFPAHRIKVDRSFIVKIDQDPEQQDMLETILLMADRLGLAALVEGVETPAEMETLRRLNCVLMQGFGIAKPMDADAFTQWAQTVQVQNPSIAASKVA
ncbi:MAG: bifunctional diguanylate cyclase/phosphodiesterase [Pseudomonadota bacterium]